MKTTAYLLGAAHKKLGFSIYYNPFRHVGDSKDFQEWLNGWKEEN